METEGTGRQKMKYEGERDEWEEMIGRPRVKVKERWGDEEEEEEDGGDWKKGVQQRLG